MLGTWKSFDDLEENISLPELNFILKAKREQEREDRKFAAGIQGIDLEKESGDVQKKIEEVQRRAQAKLLGGELEVEKMEFADLGFAYEAG